MVCYDCKTEVDDFVMETRQTAGGDGVVYRGDFTEVPVCSSRRQCLINHRRKQAAQQYWGHCPVCNIRLVFTEVTEHSVVKGHLLTHDALSLIRLIQAELMPVKMCIR